jgi:isopenicillin N synthase-like dioxygenase
VAKRLPFKSIPIIDFGGAFSTNVDDRKAVAMQIHDACSKTGFFYLSNHGVAEELIGRAFDATREFFSLPFEQKMELHISKYKHYAGYIPVQGERLYDADRIGPGDLKESLEICSGLPDPDGMYPPSPFAGESFLPERYTRLQQIMGAYYERLWVLTRVLTRISALGLSMPEDYFDSFFHRNPIANLRLLHYPPLSKESDSVEKMLGAGAHSDYLWFTLLAQDNVGGLEVLNSSGEWIEASPIPGTFVVNTGDMIAHITNDLYPSTVHRVTRNTGSQARYSIAFLTGPNVETQFKCLPSCTDSDHPPKYPPVKAGDYLYQRLSSTGAIANH